MSIYNNWGFTRSPFQQTSLPADETGEKLLVGRDAELTQLISRLQDSTKIPIVEGLNGIGKTSLVNVAAHRLYQTHLAGRGALFIPCRKIFQLKPGRSSQDFVDDVLLEVAQTIIERKNDFLKGRQGIDTALLDRWLNKPEIKSFSGGAWGFQGGYQASQNTGSGFERSGFRKAVTEMLGTIFPDEEAGGIICCIDNLELLVESSLARRALEELRDELLQVRGLRWVLCGALGITYGVASSPRLDGYLQRPIELVELNKSFAPQVFNSRIAGFAKREKPYVPLEELQFDELYEILRGNLRSVLSYTDNYCVWASERNLPKTADEKKRTFKDWLIEEGQAAYDVARSVLTKRTLKVFDQATKEAATFSPSDYERFGFNKMQNFRPYIKNLEDVSLVISTQDETDMRRKTIQVTAKGRLVSWFMNEMYEMYESERADAERDYVDEPSEDADVI